MPDRVICVSEGVGRVAARREGLASDPKLRVIHNGVDIPERFGEPDAVRRKRAELGIQPGERVIGVVTNLNRPVKGVEYLIKATPTILRAVPEARFLIFGDGPLRPDLEASARELGVASRITFMGFRSDVRDWYQLFEISSLTSLSEGLSVTILESMAFGVPVVATRVGGNPEIVVDGRTGLLVPPREPVAFAEAVIGLLRDRNRLARMGEHARQEVQRFSTKAVAQRYDAVYREVARQAAIRPS